MLYLREKWPERDWFPRDTKHTQSQDNGLPPKECTHTDSHETFSSLCVRKRCLSVRKLSPLSCPLYCNKIRVEMFKSVCGSVANISNTLHSSFVSLLALSPYSAPTVLTWWMIVLLSGCDIILITHPVYAINNIYRPHCVRPINASIALGHFVPSSDRCAI